MNFYFISVSLISQMFKQKYFHSLAACFQAHTQPRNYPWCHVRNMKQTVYQGQWTHLWHIGVRMVPKNDIQGHLLEKTIDQ